MYIRRLLGQEVGSLQVQRVGGVALSHRGEHRLSPLVGAHDHRPVEQTDPTVTVAQMRDLLASLGALPLAARQQVRGLPPARADVR